MNLSLIRDGKVGEMNESLLSIKSFPGTGKYRRAASEAIWDFSLCIPLLFQQALLLELDLLGGISKDSCPAGGCSV